MNLNVKDFLELYNTKSIVEVSKELGVEILTLSKWMKENSIKLKNRKEVGLVNGLKQTIHISKEDLYQKFIIENMTRKHTAEFFGVSEALIKKKCGTYGIKKETNKYIQNTQKSLIENYGTINIRVISSDKIEKTNLKKYGVRTPFHSIKIQKKAFKNKKPSNLEKKAMEILDLENISYEKEYFIKGYKDRIFLSYDFAIFKRGTKKAMGFIEVDGVYHISSFYGEDETVRKKLADEYKNEYCKEKGIPLLRITAEDDFKEKILKFIDEIM